MARTILPDPMGRLTLFRATPIHDSVADLWDSIDHPAHRDTRKLNYFYRTYISEIHPIPISGVFGNLSSLEPGVGNRPCLGIYDQETFVWGWPLPKKPKSNGEIYLVGRNEEHWGPIGGLPATNPDQFAESYRTQYRLDLPRFGLVRARGAKSARATFANAIRWETPFRRFYNELPYRISINLIARNLEHIKIPEEIEELMRSVNELLVNNRVQLMDTVATQPINRYVIELRLEVDFSEEVTDLGFEVSGLANARAKKLISATRTSYQERFRKKFRLIPTLVGDDGIGVAFSTYAEAVDAITTWVKAVRSGTDLITMRRKIREGRE